MTRREWLALVSAAAAARSWAAEGDDDVLLRAMVDELERSRTLQVTSLEKPYFIEYAVSENRGFSIQASLGALISSSQVHFRLPSVRVRVGSAAFDNANYIYSDVFSGSRYDPEQLTIDDDYAALRRAFWLATDRTYKTAVEAIGRKRAALKNLNVTEELPDLWPAEAVQMLLPLNLREVDRQRYEERVRVWSQAFAEFPDIISSNLMLAWGAGARYLVNTDGARMRVPENLAILQIRAYAHAPDGSIVRDAASIETTSLDTLPSDEDVVKAVRQVAASVRALAAAKTGETYAGPVLFEGLAGAQLMAEVLGRELGMARRPLSEPGRPAPFRPSDLEGRIGSRILPEFLDVVDDPTLKEFEGTRLLGSYAVDEEGVVPKPLTVVEKGQLKTLLLTRQPVKGFSASNGRARLPGGFGAKTPAYSNLVVSASESLAGAELRKKLLELAAARGKPWGFIVRRMDFPSSASMDELRRIAANMQQSGSIARPVSLPLVAFKVYPDGREEQVRGLHFRNLNVRSLRDIVAVSKERQVFSFLNNMAPFALMGAGGFVAPTSVVAPSLLLDEAEMEHPREDQQKLPLVPPPAIGGK